MRHPPSSTFGSFLVAARPPASAPSCWDSAASAAQTSPFCAAAWRGRAGLRGHESPACTRQCPGRATKGLISVSSRCVRQRDGRPGGYAGGTRPRFAGCAGAAEVAGRVGGRPPAGPFSGGAPFVRSMSRTPPPEVHNIYGVAVIIEVISSLLRRYNRPRRGRRPTTSRVTRCFCRARAPRAAAPTGRPLASRRRVRTAQA